MLDQIDLNPASAPARRVEVPLQFFQPLVVQPTTLAFRAVDVVAQAPDLPVALRFVRLLRVSALSHGSGGGGGVVVCVVVRCGSAARVAVGPAQGGRCGGSV